MIKKVTIEEHQFGQRVDNFLLSQCKGVPKTRIYKALRKGEVRVNQKRVKPDYRLMLGDVVRIPPLRVAQAPDKKAVPFGLRQQIEASILQETPDFLIVDKPSGIPVHGGTGIYTGLIEAIRELRPRSKFLELVHRLDRDTSGCLVIAKKRATLVHLHELLRLRKVKKRYLTLVQGSWQGGEQRVKAPLHKNVLAGGERMVMVSEAGKAAETIFRPIKIFKQATLLEALPITGRTHQIRVHAAHLGYPIAGDEKYGDRDFNQAMKRLGLKRLFLHSSSIHCRLSDEPLMLMGLCAPLSAELQLVLDQLTPVSESW